MSAIRFIEKVFTQTISSTLPLESPGNLEVELDGAPCVAVKVPEVSGSPVIKVYVKEHETGDWEVLECFQRPLGTAMNASSSRAPDTSVSLTAYDTIYVITDGFFALKLDLQSGTSAYFTGRTCEVPNGLPNTQLQTLINAASALDANIVKWNGDEYTIQRKRGLVLATAGVTTLLAASTSKYNVILPHMPGVSRPTIHIKTGGTTESFYISDGTIDLFGSSSGVKPVDISGATGPFGYELPAMVTSDVNKPITITITGAGSLVADFDYIQPNP